MATELEFVNYKEFVENLSSVDSAESTDRSVVSNSSDGPRAVDSFTKQNNDKIFANKIESFLSFVDIGASQPGYINYQGAVASAGDSYRHFVCPVVKGRKYIVTTRLGSSSTFIYGWDASTSPSSVVRYDVGHDNPTVLQDYTIIPSMDYLAISYKTNASSSAINSEDAYASVRLADDEVEKDIQMMENVAGLIATGESKKGYIDYSGSVAQAGNYFRYFAVKVEVGKKYVVHTRLGSASAKIAAGDTGDAVSGLSLYNIIVGDASKFNDYVITATKNYLYFGMNDSTISNGYDVSNDYKVYVKELSSSEIPPNAVFDGILPSRFGVQGTSPASSATAISYGIFVRYGYTLTEKAISKLRFYANQAGFIRFGVGIIDQRNWAIVSKTIDVACSAGMNEVSILDKGLVTPANGYLFAYNNADGAGTCICYKLYTSSSVNNMFFSEDYDGAINKAIGSDGSVISATLGTTKSYALGMLEYEYVDENLFYEDKVAASERFEWLKRTINAAAQAIALKNVIFVGRDKYKVVKNNNAAAVEPYKFNKITIFGNSIFLHAATSGWLYPVTIGGVEYSYQNEPGANGMWGRGMAASVQAVDFKHIILEQAKKLNPSVVVQGTNISDIERPAGGSFPIGSAFGKATLLTSDVDCILYCAGENVSMVDDTYKAALESWVEYWQASCPNALIVLCGRYWTQDECDKITASVAHKYGLPFIWKRLDSDTESLKDDICIYPVTDGVNTVQNVGRIAGGAGHPGDVGMFRIAKEICDVLGMECDDLEHNVVLMNNSPDLVHCPKTWVYKGVCSIQMNGASEPSVSVTTSDGTVVSTETKTKAEIGSTCDYVVYFEMPDEDVYISFS